MAIVYRSVKGSALTSTDVDNNFQELYDTDATSVHLTGNETIAGIKTFSNDPIIPDEAYGAGWNGVLEPTTKNAVYDKIELLDAAKLNLSGGTMTGNLDLGGLGILNAGVVQVGDGAAIINESANAAISFGATGQLTLDVTSITLNHLTATTVPYLDASKNLVSSAVTPTELGYLSGVKSSLPTVLRSVVASQFDKTDTTLANITGLTATLEAGATYSFVAKIFYDADAGGGVKVSLSGTATATTIIAEAVQYDDASNTTTVIFRFTSLGGSVGQTGSVAGLMEIEGTIIVNAGGTFIPQFAQNAASGTSSVLVGSTFIVTKI